MASPSLPGDDVLFVFSPEEELVIEHLGFVFMHFVDEVIDAANTRLQQGVAALERSIGAEYDGAPPEDEVPELEFERGLAQLETLLQASTDTRFDQFELICTRHIFNLPTGLDVRLPLHEGLDLSATEADEKALDLELESLRKKLAAQKFVQHKLSTALAEQTSQLPLYQSLRPILPSLALPEMTPAQLSALHSSALKIRDLISQTMPAVLDPFSASGKVPVLKPADRAGYLRSLVLRQLDRLSKMEKRRRSTGEERARMEKEDEEEAAQDMGWVMTDVAGIDEAKALDAKLRAALGRPVGAGEA